MPTTAGKPESRIKGGARANQLRPLNLPQPVEVELDDAGLPLLVASAYRRTAVQPYSPESAGARGEATESNTTTRAVESVLEIWRVDDEWWREPISRRYVEVILKGGKHVVLYEDVNTGDWFMQKP